MESCNFPPPNIMFVGLSMSLTVIIVCFCGSLVYCCVNILLYCGWILGYFKFLQIMLRIFLCIHIFWHVCINVAYILKNGITRSQGIHMFSFSGYCKNSFPQWWFCFTVLLAMYENPVFSV